MNRKDNIIRFADHTGPRSTDNRAGADTGRGDLHWGVEDVKRIIFDFGDHDQPHLKSIGR